MTMTNDQMVMTRCNGCLLLVPEVVQVEDTCDDDDGSEKGRNKAWAGARVDYTLALARRGATAGTLVRRHGKAGRTYEENSGRPKLSGSLRPYPDRDAPVGPLPPQTEFAVPSGRWSRAPSDASKSGEQ